MKTIWIIDHYSSEPKYGGIQRQFDFANELDNRGYRVIIFSSGFSHYTHNYISQDEYYISEVSKNVHYVYLKTHAYTRHNGKDRALNMYSFERLVIKYAPLIEKKFGKPNVIEGASVHPLAWVAASKLAKKYKVRFVAEVRDFWPQYWIDSGEMKPYHPMAIFFSIIEKRTFSKADHIIYSLYHGDRYICGEKNVPKERTTLIGQPMNCNRFDNLRNNTDLLPNELMEFLKDGFICAFTGYYMEYEGVYVMLEAQKLLEEEQLPIKMIFVGSGQEKKGMKEYVKKNFLSNVYIGDRVSKEAIPALLSKVDACMAHIDTKGHADAFKYGVSKNKINDYMYSGKPILFGFRFQDNEVSESGGGLQFTPYDSAELARQIKELYLMDEKKRKEYGKRAQTYIKKNHDVVVLTNKLINALFGEKEGKI